MLMRGSRNAVMCIAKMVFLPLSTAVKSAMAGYLRLFLLFMNRVDIIVPGVPQRDRIYRISGISPTLCAITGCGGYNIQPKILVIDEA